MCIRNNILNEHERQTAKQYIKWYVVCSCHTHTVGTSSITQHVVCTTTRSINSDFSQSKRVKSVDEESQVCLYSRRCLKARNVHIFRIIYIKLKKRVRTSKKLVCVNIDVQSVSHLLHHTVSQFEPFLHQLHHTTNNL